MWLIVAWLSGCSSAPAPIPSECEHSLIYQSASDLHTTPKAAGTIFQLADMRLIRSNSVAKSDVVGFLNDVQDLLESGTTTILIWYPWSRCALNGCKPIMVPRSCC